MSESRRYLGLDLAGAKNQKTALATLEYYPKEKKVFLLDIYDRISAEKAGAQSGDEVLLELINEVKDDAKVLGVNVPLVLPPCITCVRKTCPMPAHCVDPAVKWMRGSVKRAGRHHPRGVRVNEFTPYTQRPVELWVRYEAFAEVRETARFEVDETLGGNRAPLTARMNFLQRHVGDLKLFEVWPKLSVASLASSLGLHRNTIDAYRQLQSGVHAREEILESLTDRRDIFIYERDIRKLSHSLAAFDAFICAYTALLSDLGLCLEAPRGFPVASGWVQCPDPAG